MQTDTHTPGPATGIDWRITDSVEITEHDADALKPGRFGLPAGTRAFIPWLPTSTGDSLLRAAALVREAGLVAVPHIAARRLTSLQDSVRLLERLAASGTHSILLIGSDVEQPRGPFGSALEVLRSGIIAASGIRSVGLACYPEPHPHIAAPVLQREFAAKLACAERAGLEAFAVSQFCFDGSTLAAWLSGFRAQGYTLPVKVGIAGPASLRKLMALGLRCGIGNSLRLLGSRTSMIASLATSQGPDNVVADFLAARAALTGSLTEPGPVSLHVFAFGGIEAAARWMLSARRA